MQGRGPSKSRVKCVGKRSAGSGGERAVQEEVRWWPPQGAFSPKFALCVQNPVKIEELSSSVPWPGFVP